MGLIFIPDAPDDGSRRAPCVCVINYLHYRPYKQDLGSPAPVHRQLRAVLDKKKHIGCVAL